MNFIRNHHKNKSDRINSTTDTEHMFRSLNDHIHTLKNFITCVMNRNNSTNFLNIVFDWAIQNKIPVNKEKTNALLLSKKNKPTPNNLIIKTVESTKILGVTFTRDLKFNLHVKKKILEAYKYLQILKTYVSHKFGLSSDKRITLYNCFVKPSLLNASEIWSNNINYQSKRSLVTLDNALLRNAINAFKSTPIDCLHLLTRTPLINDILILRRNSAALKIRKIPVGPVDALNNNIIIMGNWNIEHDITIDINYQFNDHFILCHSSINIVQGNHTFDVYTKYWFHTGLVDAIDNSIRKSLKLLLNHHYLHQSKIIVYTPIKSGLYKIQTISSKNIMKIVQFLNLSYSTIYVKHIERYTYTNQVDVSRIKISFKYYAKSKINEIIKSHLNESMLTKKLHPYAQATAQQGRTCLINEKLVYQQIALCAILHKIIATSPHVRCLMTL
ncbi:hypothetical protein DERF_012041 [Dermatophagoides farinae]|uniref:Reverse transcriptase domain-containing protein n=1 Tax=Dermatophagoides farinae TaxID=6954 RepID=A0A922KZN5_DERFA|nr:hypothetical protein DERF_012041 [Dermatophagoides farinae]